MDRRSALATAGAVAITLSASAVAIAVNMGLLGSRPTSDVGRLTSTGKLPEGAAASPQPEIVTIFRDETARATEGSSGDGDVRTATVPDTVGAAEPERLSDDDHASEAPEASGGDGAQLEPREPQEHESQPAEAPEEPEGAGEDD